MKKRVLSLLLVLTLLLSLFAGSFSFAAEQAYAVILGSAQDGDTASVTLGFSDNTSDTFTVSSYQDEDEVLHTETFSSFFAANALVGDIVSVTFCSNGTVDLITEASFCEGSTQIRDGGMVYNGKQFWSTAVTPLFLLYTDGENAKPVRFQTCSMAVFPDFSASAIPVYTSETESQALLGCTALPPHRSSRDLEFAVITYGTTPPTVTVAPDKVGYVVESVIKRVGGQKCLELSVIDAENSALVSGVYPYAPEDLLALPVGTKLTGSDEFAAGTIVGFAHNGEEFEALNTYASESALNEPYEEYDGYYKATVSNADDGRIAFYPYYSQTLSVLTAAESYSAVGISQNRPVGAAVEVIPNGTTPKNGDYNAIIEVKYGKVNAVWSLYDLMDGSTESAQPEANAADYAVVLRSFCSSADTATVKLALADNTVEEVTVTGYSDGKNTLPLSALDCNEAVGSLVTVTRGGDTVTLTLVAPFVQGIPSIRNKTLHAADGSMYFHAKDAPIFLLYAPSGNSKTIGALAYYPGDLADRLAYEVPVWTQPEQSETFRGTAVAPASEPGFFSAAVMTYGIGVPGMSAPQPHSGYVVEYTIESLSYFNQNAVRVTLIDSITGKQTSGLCYDVPASKLEAFLPGSIVSYRHDGLDFMELDLSQYGTLEFQEKKLDASNPAYGNYKVTITAITDSSLSFIAYGDTEVQTLPLLPNHSTLAIRNGAAIGNVVEVLPEPPESGYNAVIETQYNGKISRIYSIHQGPPPIGDLIGDGAVDVYDAVLLFQHSMLPDLYPINYDGSLDFNKDGAVDVYDAVLLFQHSMLPDLYPIQ